MKNKGIEKTDAAITAAEEERSAGKRGGGFIGKVLYALAALLFTALFCLAAVLVHPFDAEGGAGDYRASDFEVKEENDVPRIWPGESSDIGGIRAICGFPLPYFAGQMMYAEAGNVEYGGKNAVRVTMRYQSGMEIEAVRPPEAAPVIRRDGMEVMMYENLRVPFAGMQGGIGAIMCRGKADSCLYFSTDDAAYSIYAPVGPELLYRYVSETGLSVR